MKSSYDDTSPDMLAKNHHPDCNIIINCDRNSKETTGHPKINVLLASWGVAAINNS